MGQYSYRTIKEVSTAIYTEKKSKFIAFAIPVKSADEAKEKLYIYRKEYYDARHICWAYMLGADRKDFRANDDGEPSGTAGKPILGQINSFELTNVLILVIRYFGGIKLGTSGLISAYRQAAQEAITQAEVIEETLKVRLTFEFEYPLMSAIMKIIKESKAMIVDQNYIHNYQMTIEVEQSIEIEVKKKLEFIETVHFLETNG